MTTARPDPALTPSRRRVPAPPPTHPGLAAAVLDVECEEGETVEWIWTRTPAGSFVSGYRIVAQSAVAP